MGIVTMNRIRRNALCALIVLLFASFAFTLPAHAAANVSAGARLSIPSLNLNVQIIEANQITIAGGFMTWDLTTLGTRVAHLEGTAWTGDGPNKNIVLAGHNTLANGRPSIFYHLERIHVGDNIVLSQGGTNFTYAVTRTMMVDPSQFDVIYPTGKDQLTLLTCAGSFSSSLGGYTKRFVVVAERVG